MTMMPDEVLRTEGLHYRYPQNGQGLPPTDFVARAGELWAISGPSGCGKSTLARCLTGLIPHLYRGDLHGDAWVCGRNTRHHPIWQLGEDVGFLFQNPAEQIVGSTVEDEVQFGLLQMGLDEATRRKRCQRYLDKFGLLPLRRRSPHTLSGGERQRLMLAAVLAGQPRALVLDEPFSMLDSTICQELIGHIGELVREGTAVAVCEHRTEWFSGCEDVQELVLRDGHYPRQLTGEAKAVMPGSRNEAGVQIDGVSARLGGQTVLDDVNLRLQPGEVIALVGRNGAGKTTLLRALAGLQPFQGQIETTDGQRPLFGLLFQNPDWQLFNPSVRAEIRHRLDDPDETLYRWLLEALDLCQYEDVQPLLLSEGQKKRLALATLLMHKPPQGILLDEPTLGQDARHGDIMGQIAHALASRGQIALAATHDLAWAQRYADRVILLSQGRVLEQGPTAMMLAARASWERAGLLLPAWLTKAES